MRTISRRNVQQMLPEVVHQVVATGVPRETRNGPVLQLPGPTILEYRQPTERVIFWQERDANPFFHLFESIWMLAGRNDVASVVKFASNMKNFSDDGKTFHGAYGKRWRDHFLRSGRAFDQLDDIVTVLGNDVDDRRCVLQMWDPEIDLAQLGKDFPCNVSVVFQIDHNKRLNLTLFNRSNDIVWGMLGANAVHFTMLQEYMAARIGVPVGMFWQVSTNAHAYLDTFEKVRPLEEFSNDQYWGTRYSDPYEGDRVSPSTFVHDADAIDEDIHVFMKYADDDAEAHPVSFTNPFFSNTLVPMINAHRSYRHGRGESKYRGAIDACLKIQASDWRQACTEWLERRLVNFQKAADDGPSY